MWKEEGEAVLLKESERWREHFGIELYKYIGTCLVWLNG